MDNTYNSQTKAITENVKCPYCDAEKRVKVTLTVDAQDSKLVKKLLDNTLFLHKCSKCQNKYNVFNPFVYLDEENSIAIHCTQGARYFDEVVNKLLYNRSTIFDQKFRFTRAVTEYKEFKEKYIILSNGLDDRIIEFIKLDIRENRSNECGPISDIRCIDVQEKWITIRAVGEKKAQVFHISIEEYEDFKSRYAHWLNNYKPVVIDASWAIDHAD